jgi:hypothetical protein
LPGHFLHLFFHLLHAAFHWRTAESTPTEPTHAREASPRADSRRLARAPRFIASAAIALSVIGSSRFPRPGFWSATARAIGPAAGQATFEFFQPPARIFEVPACLFQFFANSRIDIRALSPLALGSLAFRTSFGLRTPLVVWTPLRRRIVSRPIIVAPTSAQRSKCQAARQ